MKVASIVLLSVDLASSIICFFTGFFLYFPLNGSVPLEFSKIFLFLLIYGSYGIVVSIGGLIGLRIHSYPTTIVFAILNIPMGLLTSIFMFCIDQDYFYSHINFKKYYAKKRKHDRKIQSLPLTSCNYSMPFYAYVIKNYFGVDENNENVSIRVNTKVKIIDFCKQSGTYSFEYNDGELNHTVCAVPSFYLGLGKVPESKKEINTKSNNDNVSLYPCKGLIINKYFGEDTKGNKIILNTQSVVTILSSNVSTGTYDIEFEEDNKKHLIKDIPSFYVQLLKKEAN